MARAVDADANADVIATAALHCERERDNMSNILCHTRTHTQQDRAREAVRGRE